MAPEPTILASRSRPKGAVTLVALCLLATLSISLATYLALTSHSTRLSKRVANQEQVQQLSQVALEEALWTLNQNNWTSSGPNGNTTWTTSGANRSVTLNYTLSDQKATGRVNLTIANYASTGPTTWPTITANTTVTLPSGEVFAKNVQATTGPLPVFGNAIASSDSYVSFSAGGTVDSYNSDPDNDPNTAAVAYTAGTAAANYNAVVAGNTNGTYGVLLTQAEVHGYVSTSGLPISYSTSGSPPAKVLGPSTASGTNVDAARLGKSAFVPTSDMFSVAVPTLNVQSYSIADLLLMLVGGILNLPANVSTCRITGNLTINPYLLSSYPDITINKPVQIIVDGDFNIIGNGRLTISSTGSLQLYVKGDVSIAGNGILNQTNDPKKCAIYCLNDSTTDAVVYNANATSEFCGVIYSEHNPIDIKKNVNFYGAILGEQSIRFRDAASSPNFHYDTSLRTATFSGITTPYILKQVTEL